MATLCALLLAANTAPSEEATAVEPGLTQKLRSQTKNNTDSQQGSCSLWKHIQMRYILRIPNMKEQANNLFTMLKKKEQAGVEF